MSHCFQVHGRTVAFFAFQAARQFKELDITGILHVHTAYQKGRVDASRMFPSASIRMTHIALLPACYRSALLFELNSYDTIGWPTVIEVPGGYFSVAIQKPATFEMVDIPRIQNWHTALEDALRPTWSFSSFLSNYTDYNGLSNLTGTVELLHVHRHLVTYYVYRVHQNVSTTPITKDAHPCILSTVRIYPCYTNVDDSNAHIDDEGDYAVARDVYFAHNNSNSILRAQKAILETDDDV